jgi:plasmid stabilization system protein ParE
MTGRQWRVRLGAAAELDFGRIIEIGRILHDRMDLRRHMSFPAKEDDG